MEKDIEKIIEFELVNKMNDFFNHFAFDGKLEEALKTFNSLQLLRKEFHFEKYGKYGESRNDLQQFIYELAVARATLKLKDKK
ncbi:MAG: hypothetical protein ACRC0V_05110 [Fusobacteriaceae bacterium]